MIYNNQVYTQGQLKYVNFTMLSEELKSEVLNWRNDDRIRKWMFDKNVIELTNHLNFINKLLIDHTNFYWLVFKKERPIGVVNINNYNSSEEAAEWGFYINPALFMSNLGFELFHETINLFFEPFALKELKGFVQEDNKNALMLNDFFGMKHFDFVLLYNKKYSFRKITFQEWKSKKKTLQEAKKQFIQYVSNSKSK